MATKRNINSVAAPELTDQQLKKLTVAQLKIELVTLGLTSEGKKTDLVKRLLDARARASQG